MIPYYIFFCFLFFISFYDLIKTDIKFSKKIEDLLYIVLWLALVFFIGFRYKLANDWYNYEGLINNIEPLNQVVLGNAPFFHDSKGIEFGFKLLCSMVNLFFSPSGGAFQALTAVVSVFCYSILISVTRKEDSIPYKFIFLSIFISLTMFREFDVLRQSIALYIFLISIKYLNNNFLKYFFINILGSFFHISALIFIPFYFVFKMKFHRLFILILLIIYVLSMVVHFSFVTAFTDRLSTYFPELIFVQKLYATSIMGEPSGSISIVGLVYVIFLVLLFFNYNKIDFGNYKIRFFINVFLVFILINILFSDAKEVADRFSYYFYIGLAFVFVYLIQFIRKDIVVTYIVLIMAFPFIRFSRIMANPEAKSVNTPYRNYFFITPEDDIRLLINWKEKNEK